MKWQVRFLLRSIFRFLPFQYQLRAFKRRTTPFNAENARGVLDRALTMIEMTRSIGYRLENRIALELGTGWEPTIPLLLRLAGCAKVYMVDVHRLLDPLSIERSCAFLFENKKQISNRLQIPSEKIETFFANYKSKSLDALLKDFDFEYLAPFDARRTALDDQSIDFIVSHTVLEHIPPDIITGILNEFRRIIRPDGKMCHLIDNADHWSYNDSSITPVHFLKHSPKVMKLIGHNPIDYQNRLRHFEYLDMFEKAGFIIELDHSFTETSYIESVKKMKISKQYHAHSPNELAITLSVIISAPKADRLSNS